MKEIDIQNQICQYLELKHFCFWRQNTSAITGMRNGERFFKKMPKYSMNGIPDIIIIRNGKFIGLEVKVPKGKQSESQIEFERLCNEAGGEYHVVRSVEDVIKALQVRLDGYAGYNQ